MSKDTTDWSNSALQPGILGGAGYDENGKPIVVKLADSFVGDSLVTAENKKEFPCGKPEIIEM